MGRLLSWTVFLAIIGVMIAPGIATSTRILAFIIGLITFVFWLKGAFVRWIKHDDKAPTWDEIQSVPPIFPEPAFKAAGPIGRAFMNRFAKWTLSQKDKNNAADLNAMGELFDIGTKYTPKNPVEAMRWYLAATGGDPVRADGHQYAKLRIAEMFEDGEGVACNLERAGRIYESMPAFPSAMLHFAIAHVDGRGVPQDYVAAYKLLLLADKARSWPAPNKKQVEVDPQKRRENSRHIRTRELMTLLEPKMTPGQLWRANDAAREWWNAHR